MAFEILASTWRVLWYPSVLGVSAAATVLSHAAFRLAGTDAGFWSLPQSHMAIVAVIVVLRGWATLSVSATAVTIIRHRFVPRPVYWVPATTAFEAGAVTSLLALATMAGLLLLVVPGVVMALAWSQATLLILDRRANWFEAAGESWDLTAGRRLTILLVWLVTGGGFALVGWITTALVEIATVSGLPTAVPLALALAARVVTDAFGACLLAGTYCTLDPEDPDEPTPAAMPGAATR